ncbi:MAG: hypothetical protein ACP5I4_11725 [Oceanipulchritudo sp.]
MKNTLRYLIPALAGWTILPVAGIALEVNVERMDVETGLPWGYVDGTGLRACTETYSSEAFDMDLSAAPFVDYMVAFNSGSPGILAEKETGAYLDATHTTVGNLSGGANGNFAVEGECGTGNALIPVGTERFAAMFKWSDGTPLPSATGWFGVSWGGWSATEIEEMEVRVDLASEGQINVVHWFNDGWLYSTDLDGTEGTVHTILEGHEFTVTHHAADGSVMAEVPFVLPSGGAGDAIGKTGDYLIRVRDHRQFYTATMSATRTAPGDYLMLKHRAANIGYRATAITLGNDTPWESGTSPDPWFGYAVDELGWADASPWLDWVNVSLKPWVYVQALGKYSHIQDDSGWVYIPKY